VTRALHPTTEQLLKAAPKFARAAVEFSAKLYLAGEGEESGPEITPELRDELLTKLAAGGYVAIDALILAYEQREGVDNRNFVLFRPGELIALGATGQGNPFLRDHAQHDSMSVAGRILTSQTKKISEERYEMYQRVRLTATWAVDLALRDLLFGVSIGWEALGPVLCTVHSAPIGTKCYCWPGARLAESTDSEGNKKYEYNRAGTIRARWMYTKASLLETSMCPIGAVKLAGFEGVRSALSAVGFDLDENGDAPALMPTPDPTPSLEIDRTDPKEESDSNMSTELQARITQLETELKHSQRLASLTDAQRAHHVKLLVSNATDASDFLAKSSPERDAILQALAAADAPIWTGKITGFSVRKSDGELALKLAKDAESRAEKEAATSEQLRIANEATALAALKVRVSKEIASLAGKEEDKVEVLRAIDTYAGADEDKKSRMLGVLRSGDAFAALAGKVKGVNPGTDPSGATLQDQFDALTAAHVEKHKCDERTARLAVVKTEKGRALYNAIELQKKSGAAFSA
jgi:hypothetical protein